MCNVTVWPEPRLYRVQQVSVVVPSCTQLTHYAAVSCGYDHFHSNREVNF